MPIPEPLTPIAITTGVVTNIATDILKHRAQSLENTLAGRMLKWAGLIEPDFDDRLRETLVEALTLYFDTHPEYQLSLITTFFRDPIVAEQIGGYILDRQPLDEAKIQEALTQQLSRDVTSLLLKQRGLDRKQIVPDFLACYRRVLNQQLTVPQMSILLEVVDQSDRLIAEIRNSETRLENRVAELLEQKLSPETLRQQPTLPPQDQASEPASPIIQEHTMAGIPSHLSKPLHDILEECEQFESNRTLRDLFAHDAGLRPWRRSLPEASRLSERVSSTIAFLHDKYRRDGSNALVLLLRVLRDWLDQEDDRHQRLTRLIVELEPVLVKANPSSGASNTTSNPAEPRPPAQTTTATSTVLEPELVPDRIAAKASPTEPEAKKAGPKGVDFFVSYNRNDRHWAEWIAWQLETAGYTTVVQAWDFRPGGNFVTDMQRATTNAERTIAVLSPDYLASQFTQPEWNAAFAQDPTGEKGLLVPVRVKECELTGLLPQVVYIDLVNLDQASAKRALLSGVKRGRAKPAVEPGFPGASVTTDEAPDFPGEETDR